MVIRTNVRPSGPRGGNPSLAASWNPLGIVALFASLAETCAAVVLVRLPPPVMQIYIWFVMIFPLVLIVLFFVILYRKPVVFYPPWAFTDQDILDSFIDINRSWSKLPTIKGTKRSRKRAASEGGLRELATAVRPRIGRKKSRKTPRDKQSPPHGAEQSE